MVKWHRHERRVWCRPVFCNEPGWPVRQYNIFHPGHAVAPTACALIATPAPAPCYLSHACHRRSSSPLPFSCSCFCGSSAMSHLPLQLASPCNQQYPRPPSTAALQAKSRLIYATGCCQLKVARSAACARASLHTTIRAWWPFVCVSLSRSLPSPRKLSAVDRDSVSGFTCSARAVLSPHV